ncbi:MAG: ATP-dependent DNA helicase, partial [Candidatus Aminicenantes bacterium]|nr:ATP-dependent DNA helicase [Candidatus Aminicenantes bacterium]
MTKHLKIPVRALVEYLARSGDLVMEFSTANRLVDGTRAHQEVQASRPAEYTSEMRVSLQIERRDYILEIGGRIDGIYHYPDGVIIEEIKSTSGDL